MMTLIKDDKTIAYTKKSYNFFIFNWAMLGQVILGISKVIVIPNQDCPTYLVSKNKRIQLFHQQLAYVCNA